MSTELVFRFIGMIGLGVGGSYLGLFLRAHLEGVDSTSPTMWAVILGLLGAGFGLLLTPFLTTRPARAIRNQLMQMPASALLAALTGLTVGLIIAGLLAFPLSLLPRPFSQIFPIIGAVLFAWLGVYIFVMRQRDIFSMFRGRLGTRMAAEGAGMANEGRSVLLDTSVIIDGRVGDVAKTGFISGTILVPKLVLNELQHIADSSEPLRRNRGRRGLEVLERLKKDSAVPVRITDMDVPGVREVDSKLVVLAKQLNCAVVTNDYNLNHVAQLQGVSVLNINELANAVKSVFLAGESLTVKLIQEGNQSGQGVGYLEDGTMVVVDDGRRFLNTEQAVLVTKVLQTTAGRMVFAKLENHK
jgi:uncharacterized protein YacL